MTRFAAVALGAWALLSGCASQSDTAAGAGGGGGAEKTPPETCATLQCNVHATCSEVDGVGSCACYPGFVGDGLACDDVDECADGTATCDPTSTCQNVSGSYDCVCQAGYASAGGPCTDIDECEEGTDDCATKATCENTDGSFMCTCKAGYGGDGTTCDDLDECAGGTADCSPNATCENTAGSFTCTCNAGYAGNGATCTDIDECTPGSALCGQNATCNNTDGAYTCDCDAGYAGDGTTCVNVDECSLQAIDCGPGSTCLDTEGSYTCVCVPGYVLDGQTCVLVGSGQVSIEAGSANASSTAVTLYLQEPGNLLLNAGAESGTLESWQVLSSGGDGWTVAPGGVFGASVFLTSYGLDKRSQTVDLLAAGYTQAELDAAPPIAIREWALGSWPNYSDSYSLKVELRNAANGVIATFSDGPKPLNATWQNVAHTFTGYGAGLRYVYFEDGGQDAEFWAGFYGAMMDGASVSVGSAQMRISNDGTLWSAWMPFAPTAPWTLDAGSGEKTVQVELKDGHGNTWPIVSDTIHLQ